MVRRGSYYIFLCQKRNIIFLTAGMLMCGNRRGPQRGWLVTPKGFIEYYKAMRKCLE